MAGCEPKEKFRDDGDTSLDVHDCSPFPGRMTGRVMLGFGEARMGLLTVWKFARIYVFGFE
jgi:hypothetical protein